MMTEEKKQALIVRLEKALNAANRGLTHHSYASSLGEGDILTVYGIALSALTQPASPALTLPWSENTCRECGSKSLSWGFAIINKSTVQNGLLRISDVDGLFYLGCDECSETVTRISPDEVVELLSALQQSINAPHTAPIEPICATGGAEWVKCSERMPEETEVFGGDDFSPEVLTINQHGEKWVGRTHWGKWIHTKHKDCVVQAWMPLPAAPEEK